MKQASKNLTFLRISMIFKIEYERTAVREDANRSTVNIIENGALQINKVAEINYQF